MPMYPLIPPLGPIRATKVVVVEASMTFFSNASHEAHFKAEQFLELFLPRCRGGSPPTEEKEEEEEEEEE